jgi:hypothetical protein
METAKWARSPHYVACGSCGKTDQPHYGHGWCEACQHRAKTNESWCPIKPLFCVECERAGFVNDKYPGCGRCHELRLKQVDLLQWRTSLDNPVVAQRVARAREMVRSVLGIDLDVLGMSSVVAIKRDGLYALRCVCSCRTRLASIRTVLLH